MKTKQLPKYAAELLKLHYESGNITAAKTLRSALYIEFGDDVVDEFIVELFNEKACDLTDNKIWAQKTMGSIIIDLINSSETAPWAIKLVQTALQTALTFHGLLDIALIYVEMDTDLLPYFLPTLKEMCDVVGTNSIQSPDIAHLFATRNYLEELNGIRNQIHDIKPEWMDQFKELVNRDEDDEDDAIEELWSHIEDMTNGATANAVIVKLIKDSIATSDDVTLYNTMICGFEGVAYFNDQITTIPFEVIEYVATREIDESRDDYATDADIIEAVFSAITDMLMYMCYDCDDSHMYYCEMWQNRFLDDTMKDTLIRITGEKSYQEFIDALKDAIAEIGDDDGDEDDPDWMFN